MSLDSLRSVVSRRPWTVVACWMALALTVGLLAPNLTRLAAEGQAKMLPRDAECLRAAEMVGQAWPEQAYESMAVVALHRREGLTAGDLAYARRLAARFERADRPREVLRVLGPLSRPEIADRLVSSDRTTQLIALPLAKTFVAPASHEAVAWLQAEARQAGSRDPGGARPLLDR